MVEAITEIMKFIERGATRVIVGQAKQSTDYPIGELESLYNERGVMTVYDVDQNRIVFEMED